MPRLDQSTATTRAVFMTSSTDHLAGLTGLGTALTIAASKAGAAFAAITPTVAELANGWYSLALTTGHTDTPGDLALHITGAGCDPTDKLYEVLPVNTPANLIQVLGSSVSVSAGAVDANLVSVLGTASAGAAGYVGLDWSHMTGASATVNLSGTTISTATNLTILPVVPTDWLTAAGVKADAVTKIQAGLATPTNITAGVITTVVTTTNLTNAPTAGDFTTAMKASLNSATPIVGPVTLAGVQGSYAPAKAGDQMTLTSGERTTLAAATRDVDNTSPASGSLGAHVNSAASAGDPWTATLPGSYSAGTAGNIVGTNLNAAVSSRSTYAGADTAGTNTLLTRVPGAIPADGSGFTALIATLTDPPTASAVSSTGFTLGTGARFFGHSANLAGWRVVPIGTTNPGVSAVILSSSGNVQALVGGAWPGGEPEASFPYVLIEPSAYTGILLDAGTVAASPAPNATTFSSSSTTLTVTVAGAYIGSIILFQTTSTLGRVARVVTGHTITAGSPPTHNFTVTTRTGTTPSVGPVSTDTFDLA
jgi:hypothetical protein